MNIKSFFKRMLSVVVTASMMPWGFAKAADAGLENVALNKTVYSSGNWSATMMDTMAVDGNYSTIYASGAISAENPLQLSSEEKSGLMVDLEEICLVSQIKITPRTDMDETYSRKNWKVYVSDNIEFKNAELVGEKKLAGVFKEPLEINFSAAKKIRYIKVVNVNTMITVSELEAWGIPIGSGTGFADYSDMESSNASYLLSYLEIIKNSSSYEPLKLVTRKEAAEYMMKLINDGMESDKVYFKDVPAEHDYAKIIGACCEHGIISQAENFRPDDFISEYEFLVMILRVLGYSQMPDFDFNNSVSVNNKANELKLLKNTDFAAEENVSRENAMWIMYNALNTQVLELEFSGKTVKLAKGDYLLTDSFDLILQKGIVTANNETSLSDITYNSGNHISIDNVDYSDESETLYEYIGRRIVYGVDKDDNSVIKFGFVDFEKNSIETIKCKDLIDIDQTTVTYYNNSSKKRYKIEDAKILKNNIAFADYRMELSYFDVPDGYLELIDNDDDGVYEVINIMEPTVVDVEKISFANGLSIAVKGGEKYDFDNYDHLDMTLNGRDASEKSFMNARFVLLYATHDRKNIRVEGYSTNQTGLVGTISDEWIKIGEEEYYYSDFYNENKDSFTQVDPGDTITVYYADNKVFFIGKSESNDAETIGFILRTKVNEEEDSVSFRVYTINGSFRDLKAENKLTVDGSKWNIERIINNRDYFNKKFVKFKANSQDLLKWIDTENYVESNEADSVMKKIDGITSSCRKNIDGIWSSFVMVAAVKPNTPMFIIPMTGGSYGTGMEFEKYYSISKFSSVYTYNGQTIKEADGFYNEDSDGYAGFGFSTKNVPIISGTYAACTKVTSPIVVLSGISQTINDDDVAVGMIKGYNLLDGSAVSYIMPENMEYAVDAPRIVNDKVSGLYNTSSNAVLRDVEIPDNYLYPISNLKKGSVLRVEVSGIYITGLDLISDIEAEDTPIYTCENGLGYIYAGVLTMEATLENISDGVLKYNTGFGTAIKDYSEFSTMIIVDGKNISKVNVSELPQYFVRGKKAFMLFKAGKAIGIVISK